MNYTKTEFFLRKVIQDEKSDRTMFSLITIEYEVFNRIKSNRIGLDQ